MIYCIAISDGPKAQPRKVELRSPLAWEFRNSKIGDVVKIAGEEYKRVEPIQEADL